MDFQSWFAFLVGVLLCCAVQTSAAQLPASDNCTSNGQRISFSHSYKIDLPTSSQIKVEADPLQHVANSEVQLDPGETEENKEQNIIFRHNIHVHKPKGDCETLAHIKGLLERMEKLEKQVAELREVCSPQKCCGGSQGISPCSGHGTFLYETCSCKCSEGWEGSDCSRPTCQCHGHGRCDGGKCVCDEPYFGEDCSQQLCPENCSGNGICDTARGVCQCYEEFTGEDCSEKRCPGDCSGNGFCDTGECYCHEGFFGPDCSQVLAPQNLRLLNSTEDSLTVSWDQMIDVDNYLISYYPVEHEMLVKQVHVPKERLSYEIEGLHPSTTYNVTLRHVKKGITSEPKHLQASTVLSAPSAIWMAEEMEHSLEVEWENPPMDVDYYKLKFRSLVEMDEKQVVVPKSSDPKSRHIMTGLKPGTEYEVTVIPVKDGKEGKPSSVSGKTGIDSPTNVVTDRVSEDTATVSWNKVEAPIDRYMVRYTSADGNIKEIEVGSENSIITLLDLKPGMEYIIHIWAEKGPQRSKKASTTAVTEIDSPTMLLTDQVTEDAITVSWNKVLASIDRYRVSYTSADGYTEEKEVEKDKNVTILAGLKTGMEYVIHVWAEKGEQQSKRASTEAVTDIDSPAHLVTDQVTERTATISWDRVRAPIDRYMLNYTSADGDTEEIEVGKNKAATTLIELKPGTKYVIYLWAEKGTRQSKRTSTEAVTEMDSPKNLVADQVTEDSATISWDSVEAPIDRYMVSYTSADGDTKEMEVGKAKSITTLTGLNAGMKYTIHLWAELGSKQSKRASTDALTEIDPPKNLRVSYVTQSTGVVTWTPPAAQIDGYSLTYQGPDGTSKAVQLGPSEQRFVLEGLEQGAKYTIFVMAYKGDRQSRQTDSTFSTVSFLYPHPADCSQIQQNGDALSGTYTIYLNGDSSRPMQVYCDMTTDGGGWIVFQRRNTGELDFYKRWKNYVEGFGDPTGEFWLGLDQLHNLTSSSPIRYELRVDLRTANESAYAVYDFFQVASSRERYRLSVGNYRGNAGDAMTYHNGWKFTTWDRDNDVALSNCALTHHGAWWYKNCHLANLNGKYGESKHSEGVNWEPWKGHEFSIPFTEMKIRPQSSSNESILGRRKRTLQGRRKKIRA
ncbi:tenascin-N isoform X1 [Anas platyrhynchos]|uniref:Tenascin N n=1 Tax=Anas platyrhynchos platyrhynchos TaxID=8840 RepID=U3I5I6_ANAPP|nr:tenascin-N [Anas platyrhynchos]XP_038039182.1 tenascin-N [Anas platyrhynchos]XP_038039183.1 tenascin-N [Anas platyrhynchos]XP_038039184.1 tenascin-N [Anas platyrhynchos]